MPLKDRTELRKYQRNWEREKMKDPAYRAAHNKRKLEEQKKFRRNNPEIQKQRDRVKWLWKAYRVTPMWYDEKLSVQNDVCAICGEQNDHKHWRSQKLCPLAVDHNHDTGEARGLLCAGCNKWLGELEFLMKDVESLTPKFNSWVYRALAYLAKYA